MLVRVLLFLFVFFLVGLIVSVNSGRLPQLWGPLYAVPYGDKIGHFVLMGTFAFLANLSLSCRVIRVRQSSVMLGTIIVLALVGAEEISQAFIPTRSCDISDFIADVLGIALGAFAAKTLWRTGFRGTGNV